MKSMHDLLTRLADEMLDSEDPRVEGWRERIRTLATPDDGRPVDRWRNSVPGEMEVPSTGDTNSVGAWQENGFACGWNSYRQALLIDAKDYQTWLDSPTPPTARPEVEAIEQALRDPENQPSQLGTIPLLALPDRQDSSVEYGFPYDTDTGTEHGFNIGWNACLDEIDKRMRSAGDVDAEDRALGIGYLEGRNVEVVTEGEMRAEKSRQTASDETNRTADTFITDRRWDLPKSHPLNRTATSQLADQAKAEGDATVTVPRRPTQEMLTAGREALSAEQVWRFMVDAAPKPAGCEAYRWECSGHLFMSEAKANQFSMLTAISPHRAPVIPLYRQPQAMAVEVTDAMVKRAIEEYRPMRAIYYPEQEMRAALLAALAPGGEGK